MYSFLDTLYQTDDDDQHRRRRSPSPRLSRRIYTAAPSRRVAPDSRASKRDLGEVLETLERFVHNPEHHSRTFSSP